MVFQARQQRLTQDIAELQRIKRQLAETSSGGEEARTKKLLEEAHQKRDGAQRFEDQERAALANRGLWSDRVTSAEKEIEAREEQEKAIKGVEDRIKKLMSSESDAKIALQRAEEILAGQRQRLQDATAAYDDASGALRKTRTAVDIAKMSATLQMFRDRLLLADASQTRVNALVARLASLSVTEQEIVRIRELDTQTATEYRNLPIAILAESAFNPRRVFQDAALKELADSIRAQGVLSPLLVRPVTEQSFEIVAGARRYRAAQMTIRDFLLF